MPKSVNAVSATKNHQGLRRSFLYGVHGYIVLHLFIWYVLKWSIWGKTAMVGVLSLAAGHINSAAIMVAVILISILFFGRFFCGWFCHLRGAIELGDWALRKIGFSRYRKLREQNILLNTNFIWTFRFITLLTLLLPVFAYWASGRFHLDLSPEPLRPMSDIPGFNNRLFAESAIINMNMSLTLVNVLIGAGVTFIILFFIGFFFTYFYGQGAFCRILCPYAVLFSWLMNLNPLQTKITRVGDCTGCRKCSRNCPQGIDVSREIHHYNGKVTNRECIKCYQCMDICEHGVLSDTGKAAAPQLTPRKEYDVKPWLNPSQRHLQFTGSMSPAMDAISIFAGLCVGGVVATLGGFWYYVGAIIGFVTFRQIVLAIRGSRPVKGQVAEDQTGNISQPRGFSGID